MCLITTNETLQEAKEDICCYKILLLDKYNPERILTPFMRMPITLNQLAIAKGTPIIRRRLGSSTQPCPMFEISKGVIHCFKDLYQAAKYKSAIELDRNYSHSYQVIIAKAIISKGTFYAIGTDRDICATEVFITNKVAL